MHKDNVMTAKDLKLHTWYIEDNGWNKLWLYGLSKNKWIIFDPEMSGTIDIVSEIVDDGFDENPPKEEKKDLNKIFLKFLFSYELS